MTESCDFEVFGYWDVEYSKFVEKEIGEALLYLEHYRIQLTPLYVKHEG